MSLPDPDALGVLLTGSSLLALWVGWLWKGRPRWRRFWDRVEGTSQQFSNRRAGGYL